MVTGKLQAGETRADIITTVINKFEQAAAPAGRATRTSTSSCWWTRATAASTARSTPRCSRSSPTPAIIGFTGTPLTKAEKTTAAKFGGFIHKYPMRQAVADKAVVPLLYEGRDGRAGRGQGRSWNAGSSAPPAT